LNAKDYGAFLINVFNLWYKDFINGEYISIRMFDNLVMMIKGYPPESCDMTGKCSRGTVIESDGSLYPCDFYVIDKWKIGSVLESDFNELIKSDRMDEFVEQSIKIDNECRQCEYYFLCRGGCRRHKEDSVDRDLLKNMFCKSYKIFYSHAIDKLMQVARYS
jgi:uncharacterized protein